MKKYEIMFVVRPDLEETNINQVKEEMKKILVDKQANIIEDKPMGQKELAYEVRKFKTGYYFLFVIETENSEATDEFTRVARINENIIRHLVVRVDE